MKKFNAPEINSVELASVEAVMNSLLVNNNANDTETKKINYSIIDNDRDTATMQKYWSGK